MTNPTEQGREVCPLCKRPKARDRGAWSKAWHKAPTGTYARVCGRNHAANDGDEAMVECNEATIERLQTLLVALLSAGNSLATIAYNLSQSSIVTQRDSVVMKECVKLWDEARKAR